MHSKRSPLSLRKRARKSERKKRRKPTNPASKPSRRSESRRRRTYRMMPILTTKEDFSASKLPHRTLDTPISR
jgi:hypothetical protein